MGWGAFASALGSIGSSALSFWNTGKQHERNKEMAKYVGENAHQWEVNDLRNAGLNPILSSGGSGNAGGASPTSFVTPDFGQSINSGRMAAAQSKLFAEQEKTEKTKQEANNQVAGKAAADAQLALSQADSLNLSNMLLRNDVNFYLSEAGRMLRNIQLGRESLGIGPNSAKNAFKLFGRF